MQGILSIDLSGPEVEALVLTVDGGALKVAERYRQAKDPALQKESLLLESSGRSASSDKQTLPNPLRSLREAIKTPWSSAVVVIPGYEYLSLNLNLPFSDQKNVNKILDYEVQDLVPFNVQEFLLQHKAVGAQGDHSYDVHVSAIPRTIVANILTLCKEAGFEPMLVSTPSGVLGALYHLAPEYYAPEAALLLARDGVVYFAFVSGGVVKSERVLEAKLQQPGGESGLKTALTEARLTLAALEKRYECKTQKIYVLGAGMETALVQQILGRPVEKVKIAELLPAADDETGIAGLGALYARDDNPPEALTNFRVREFAYSVQLKEIFSALRRTMPYMLVSLCIGALCLIGLYASREYRIHRLESAITDNIRSRFPELGMASGANLAPLKNIVEVLNRQLKTLGSPSEYSPLEAWLEISKILATLKDVSVDRLQVKENKITLKISTKDYTSFGQVTRAFTQKKDIFCEVKDDPRKTGTGVDATYTITLCT